MLASSETQEDAMKTYLAAVALSATLAQPAGAVTFPSLTTIYVGAGVTDSGDPEDAGIATSFHCANVSGKTTTLRFLVLSNNGVEGSAQDVVAHGDTTTASTHATKAYLDNLSLNTGGVFQGVINIESTESGVFCNAVSIDASAAVPTGVTLPLVRVNPHPGTVE
jgi:hypothetical protein